ncbi:hypothetical protein [Caloranaerobacter sp. DY30410]|uniref:hypothetical protein n=1 Tax=Caloranaerobacter sp. DY30410 TaxID=3238305 RepID=UPI003D0216E8
MNKVYFFNGYDRGGTYVAAKNFKEAKTIALCSSILDYLENPFVDIRGHLVRDSRTNKPITTEYEGELNIFQLQELGLLWFECYACGSDNIEILKGADQFKCLECGSIEDIPYVD